MHLKFQVLATITSTIKLPHRTRQPQSTTTTATSTIITMRMARTMTTMAARACSFFIYFTYIYLLTNGTLPPSSTTTLSTAAACKKKGLNDETIVWALGFLFFVFYLLTTNIFGFYQCYSNPINGWDREIKRRRRGKWITGLETRALSPRYVFLCYLFILLLTYSFIPAKNSCQQHQH